MRSNFLDSAENPSNCGDAYRLLNTDLANSVLHTFPMEPSSTPFGDSPMGHVSDLFYKKLFCHVFLFDRGLSFNHALYLLEGLEEATPHLHSPFHFNFCRFHLSLHTRTWALTLGLLHSLEAYLLSQERSTSPICVAQVLGQ